MKTSVNLLKMFHSEAKIIKDYDWLEANLGQLVPMEIVLRVPKAEQCPSNTELHELQDELDADETSPARKDRDRADHCTTRSSSCRSWSGWSWRPACRSVIEEEFGEGGRKVVGRAISAATFVRPLPEAGGSTTAYLKRSHDQRPAASPSRRLPAQRLSADRRRRRDRAVAHQPAPRAPPTASITARSSASCSKRSSRLSPPSSSATAILQQARPRSRSAVKASRDRRRSRAAVGIAAEAIGPKRQVGRRRAHRPPITAADHSATPVDQHRIFARTLLELLTNSRLRLETHRLTGGSDAGDDLPLTSSPRMTASCWSAMSQALDLAELRQAGAAGRSMPASHAFAAGSCAADRMQHDPSQRRGRLYGRRADRL